MIALKVISFLIALKSLIFRLYFAVGDLKERVVNAALQAEAQTLARVDQDRVRANENAAARYKEFFARKTADIELAMARHKDSCRAVTETLTTTGKKLSERAIATQDRINAIRKQG